MGKPICDINDRILVEPKCPWWINSKDDCYCFWRFLLNHSNPDGEMKEFSQGEVAKYLAVSATKIHFDTRDAISSMIEVCKKQELSILTENEVTGIHTLLEDLEELLDTYKDSDFE
jgi:hypothetical protein